MEETELVPISLDEAMGAFDEEPTSTGDGISPMPIDEAIKIAGDE